MSDKVILTQQGYDKLYEDLNFLKTKKPASLRKFRVHFMKTVRKVLQNAPERLHVLLKVKTRVSDVLPQRNNFSRQERITLAGETSCIIKRTAPA